MTFAGRHHPLCARSSLSCDTCRQWRISCGHRNTTAASHLCERTARTETGRPRPVTHRGARRTADTSDSWRAGPFRVAAHRQRIGMRVVHALASQQKGRGVSQGWRASGTGGTFCPADWVHRGPEGELQPPGPFKGSSGRASWDWDNRTVGAQHEIAHPDASVYEAAAICRQIEELQDHIRHVLTSAVPAWAD